jgi:hypothetical protein
LHPRTHAAGKRLSGSARDEAEAVQPSARRRLLESEPQLQQFLAAVQCAEINHAAQLVGIEASALQRGSLRIEYVDGE